MVLAICHLKRCYYKALEFRWFLNKDANNKIKRHVLSFNSYANTKKINKIENLQQSEAAKKKKPRKKESEQVTPRHSPSPEF